MNLELYDFRKPSRLAGEVQQQLVSWLTAACSIATEKWAKYLDTPLKHLVQGVETVRASVALAQIEDNGVAYRVALGDDVVQTLVVLPRPLLLMLAAGMHGEPCAELPTDRSLTPVEDTLVEFLLQQLLGAVQEAWPQQDSLTVTLGETEPVPKRTRLFKPDDNVVRMALSVGGPFGEQTWHWLAPQKGLSGLLTAPGDASVAEQLAGERTRLESLVGAMPLDVSVRLGGAVLHVSELAGLRPGDLVLLDQPVSSPLVASVAGEARFRVWPGRIGAKQAIQIESLVEC